MATGSAILREKKITHTSTNTLSYNRRTMLKSVRSALFVTSLSILLPALASSQTPPPQQSNKPQTMEEFLDQVWLMVAPVEIWCGPTLVATATGFFFENDGKLYLVTNRHVVRQDDPARGEHTFPDKLTLLLHTNPQDHTQNTKYEVQLYRDKKSLWREKPGVDLAAIELPVQDMLRFKFISLDQKFLPPDDALLGAGDEVLIVGYPFGFSDKLHNYPVVRTGMVASAYPVPFEGHPFFFADARLHPGTSGSPVLTAPSMFLKTRTGVVASGYRTFFLGVNAGEAQFPGGSSGLNQIWYASEVLALTRASFQSRVLSYPQEEH
jgi:S1-C subfamily serine protease